LYAIAAFNAAPDDILIPFVAKPSLSVKLNVERLDWFISALYLFTVGENLSCTVITLLSIGMALPLYKKSPFRGFVLFFVLHLVEVLFL
jgi:type IV secretory pathway component VirB8